jgi:hypothetical protein
MCAAYTALFGSLWLVRTRAEVWRRRAISGRRAPAVRARLQPTAKGQPA